MYGAQNRVSKFSDLIQTYVRYNSILQSKWYIRKFSKAAIKNYQFIVVCWMRMK